ncbi:hypothetical protein V6Z11_A12G028500 [Gossypium hirsutum]
MGGIGENNRESKSEKWTMENKKRCMKIVDPILSFNLKGGSSSSSQWLKTILTNQIHNFMDHDLEDTTLISEEGKKRSRGEINDFSKDDEISKILSRNKRMWEQNYLSSVVARRQADRVQ